MIDLQKKISRNFRWAEVVASETATRNGIDNIPPETLFPEITRHAETMELVREMLNQKFAERNNVMREDVNVPITISSWYRSPALERVICGQSYERWAISAGGGVNEQSWKTYLAAKSHPKGTATDFNARMFGPPREVFEAIRESDIQFDELIIEFDSWVHMSSAVNPRMSAFGINNSGRYQV